MKLTEKQIEAIKLELDDIDIIDLAKQQLIDEFGYITILGREFNPAEIIEELSWDLWSDYLNSIVEDLESSGNCYFLDGNYYWISDIEEFLRYENIA
jgi:hypothetical protein